MTSVELVSQHSEDMIPTPQRQEEFTLRGCLRVGLGVNHQSGPHKHVHVSRPCPEDWRCECSTLSTSQHVRDQGILARMYV